MRLRLWDVAMACVCGAMAAGNWLRVENEPNVMGAVSHLSLGLAWLVLGGWVFFGVPE